MKCDVHHSTKAASRFVIVPDGTTMASLPPALASEFNTPTWKTIEVAEGRNLLGLDSAKALNEIKAHGYHIATPQVYFEEQGP